VRGDDDQTAVWLERGAESFVQELVLQNRHDQKRERVEKEKN
jgi:hypothetical protein